MDKFSLGLILLLSLAFHQSQATTTDSNVYKVVNQYTKDNGLPVNAVTDLVIDKVGFLWIATHDGLMRFDGLSFKLFNTSNQPNMPSNRIRMLKKVESGGILVLFNLNDLYYFDGSGFTKIDDVLIDSFALDGNKLWYGTRQGLFVRDLNSHQSRQINNLDVRSMTISELGIYYADNKCAIHFYNHQQHINTRLTQLNCKKINQMKLSGKNKVAIGTDSGVYVIGQEIEYYLPDHEIIKLSWIKDRLFTLSSSLHVIEPNGQISSITTPKEWIIYLDPPAQETNDGSVWINTFSALKVDDNIAFKSPSPIFKHVIDNQGGLWVATIGHGLFYLRKPILETIGLDKNQLTTGFVTSVAKMKGGNYLTSERTGLYQFNPTSNTWKKYDSINYVDNVLYDSNGRIWVAHRGLCILDLQDKCHKQPVPESLATIQLLFEDNSGQIWVGSDEGLFIQKGGQMQLISDLDKKYVFAQEVPGKGVFLATKHHGISVFNNNKEVAQIDTNSGLPSNKIRTLYYDPLVTNEAIIIGTEDKGLCLWHFDNGLMRCASTAEGLPHYSIHHILPDQKNRLWISSNNGIFAVNIDNLHQFINHNIDYLPNYRLGISDGMADSEANGGSQATGTIGYHGNLWFPTQKGLVRVPANDIVFNQTPLKVYFDEIQVSGVIQDNHHNVIINDPNNRKLTLTFSTIALGFSDGVQFRYRIKPTAPWYLLKTAKDINFDALAPGKHNIEFQVARYGNWTGPITSLNVHVTPKLIELVWFRLMLVACVVLILLWWIYHLSKRKEQLEIEVSKRTSQLSTALNTISEKKEIIKETLARKHQHFLELSHELRTPLTLILGPLHNDKAIKTETQIIMARNADNLLNLINQILKLEQLDVFKNNSTMTNINIVSKCRIGLDRFKQETENRSLTIELVSPNHEVNIQGDSEKIDTLIINLLSNAIKFTPVGGTIRITIEVTKNNECQIIIEDSGPGIPKKDRKQVFDRFVRLNHKKVEGSGLGLAIVKKITQHHQGAIQVMDSELGGVKFEISFPIRKQTTSLASPQQPQSPSSRRSILVIDDNTDILQFSDSVLSEKYQVTTTQFPEDGLKLATRILPDLIIVDIGMPRIDGFELVTRIRNYVATKNIPVIFATARTNTEDHVKAMDIGGDAFIIKPFTAEQLLAYVNRLLTTKNNNLTSLSSDSSHQTSLLIRVKTAICQAIADSDYGVEQLASELAMSRSALYRRFKEEVDISPAEYINRCRMEHADELLRNTLLSVAKIAELTGFKQVSTFNRSFNRFFGHNPTEHRNMY